MPSAVEMCFSSVRKAADLPCTGQSKTKIIFKRATTPKLVFLWYFLKGLLLMLTHLSMDGRDKPKRMAQLGTQCAFFAFQSILHNPVTFSSSTFCRHRHAVSSASFTIRAMTLIHKLCFVNCIIMQHQKVYSRTLQLNVPSCWEWYKLKTACQMKLTKGGNLPKSDTLIIFTYT